MDQRRSQGRGDRRRILWVLAFLAVMLKVAVPPGMMLASENGAVPLLICTGHGALTTFESPGSKAPVQKSHADAPCAFAGHGVVAGPAVPSVIAVRYVRPALAPVIRRLDLAPGRGLAAPPPPSRGPPVVLI